MKAQALAVPVTPCLEHVHRMQQSERSCERLTVHCALVDIELSRECNERRGLLVCCCCRIRLVSLTDAGCYCVELAGWGALVTEGLLLYVVAMVLLPRLVCWS